MRHLIGAGVLITGVTFAIACSPSTSPLDLAGTYLLTSVNGAPLPYTLAGTGATRVELLDDAFTLNPGGTYAETGQKRLTTGFQVSYTFPVDAGNFTRRGEKVALESLIFPARAATIRNGEITLIDQDLTFVYRK